MQSIKKVKIKDYRTLVFVQSVAFLLCVFACLLEVSIAFCVDLNAEMDECARVNRFPRLSSKRRGFDFGFGSLNDTEYMCRTKFHIKIIQCVKERCEATFRSSSGPEFMKVMWSHTLNTRRSERAAAYICRQHNLRIFLQHKNLCLQELEPSAERCSHQTDEAIQEVVEALKNQSTNVSLVLTGDSFHQNLKKIMLLYECKAMKKKLGCLLSLLSSRCPTDVVQLIMNYFIESLPVGCQYSYRAPGFPDGRFANPPVMQRDDGNPPPLAHTPQQLIASTSGATATHLLLLPIHAAIYTLAGICVD